MRNINIYYILILIGIIFIMLFYKNNSKKECFDIKNNYTLAGTIVTLEDQLKILNINLNNIMNNIENLYNKTDLSSGKTTPIAKLYDSIIILLPSSNYIIDSGITVKSTTDNNTSSSQYITNTLIISDPRFNDYYNALTIELKTKLNDFITNKNIYLDITLNEDINEMPPDTKNIINGLNSLFLLLQVINKYIDEIKLNINVNDKSEYYTMEGKQYMTKENKFYSFK